MKIGTHIIDKTAVYEPRVAEIWAEIARALGNPEPVRCINCGAWLNPELTDDDLFARCPRESLH